jgi:hypothetical protein
MVCSLGGDFQENSKLGFQAENSKLFLRQPWGRFRAKQTILGQNKSHPRLGDWFVSCFSG